MFVKPWKFNLGGKRSFVIFFLFIRLRKLRLAATKGTLLRTLPLYLPALIRLEN